MSSDLSQLSQLISQLVRNTEHGQNPQTLVVNGPTNQTLQPNHGALSSGGPNASQIFQLANSNMNQYHFHFNTNLGAKPIANGDHGAYHKIEAADLNAKLSAVKELTVELKISTLELAEANAQFSKWITALNWPTLKLSLAGGPAVTIGDLAVNGYMLIIKYSWSMIEFSRLSVKFGESAVRDSDSILLAVSDTSASKFWKTIASYRKAFKRYDKSRTRYMEFLDQLDSGFTELYEGAHALDKPEASPLKELIDFDAIMEMGVGVINSCDTVTHLLKVFDESAVTYTKPIIALYDFNAKLAAVKKSTVKVGKSTAELKVSTVKLDKATVKLSEWITILNWPTFKLGLVSDQDVTLGNFVIEEFISLIKPSQVILKSGQSSVEHGESTVRDSDSISMATVGESISLVVFDALTLKLGKAAATFRESRVRFLESCTGYISHTENARMLDNSEVSRLRELMTTASFHTLRDIIIEVQESTETVATSFDAFGMSMVAYAKSLAAPDDIIAAFSPQNR